MLFAVPALSPRALVDTPTRPTPRGLKEDSKRTRFCGASLKSPLKNHLQHPPAPQLALTDSKNRSPTSFFSHSASWRSLFSPTQHLQHFATLLRLRPALDLRSSILDPRSPCNSRNTALAFHNEQQTTNNRRLAEQTHRSRNNPLQRSPIPIFPQPGPSFLTKQTQTPLPPFAHSPIRPFAPPLHPRNTLRYSDFVIRHSFVIRISSFVIRPSPLAHPLHLPSRP